MWNIQNVSILTKADRCSLFLVQGEKGSESRCLVSKLFDVCSQSTLKEMEKKEEIRIPWGTGIVGYVAQSGEPVNIPDAYKVYIEKKTNPSAFVLPLVRLLNHFYFSRMSGSITGWTS